MEIYKTNTNEDCISVAARVLQALKDASLLSANETKYCNGMSSVSGSYGFIIWPNDSETPKNYRDVIIGELTDDEEAKLTVIDRDDVDWFPNLKSENDTKLGS